MDHHQSSVRTNRHHLERPAGLVVPDEDGPRLPCLLSRQHRLRHRIGRDPSSPCTINPVLACRPGELDQQSHILHDRIDRVE